MAPPQNPPPAIPNGTYSLIYTCSANSKDLKECAREHRKFLQGMLDDHVSGKAPMPGWMALETRRTITRLNQFIDPGQSFIGAGLTASEQAALAAEREAVRRFSVGLDARLTAFPFGNLAMLIEKLGGTADQMKAGLDFGKAVQAFTGITKPPPFKEGPPQDPAADRAQVAPPVAGSNGAYVKR